MNTPENHNETDSMDSKKENKADDDASHTSSEHSANGERSEASTNTENDHGEASAHSSETNQSAAEDTSSDSDHNTENNTSSGADASTDIPPSQTSPPDSDSTDQATPLVEVSAEQKAALKKMLSSLKVMAAVMSLPLLTLGPILIIVGTLLPWSDDQRVFGIERVWGGDRWALAGQPGLGDTGGGYAVFCFAIGLLLFMTTMRAMFFGFKHCGLVYKALALASFWSTIAYITVNLDESYGLWITLAGSVVTSLAFAMQGNMMPQKPKPSSEDQAAANPLATIEHIIQAVIVGIAGLGALFSGFAWDLLGNTSGFDRGARFGVIIFVAGILILISTLLSLFNASSKEVFSFQALWFLAGATITAVTLPTLITIIFFPLVTYIFFPFAIGYGGLTTASGTGLWVALASGLVIMWQTRAVVRK